MHLIIAKIPIWDWDICKWIGSEIVEYSWDENSHLMLVNETYGTRVGRMETFSDIGRFITGQLSGKILEVVKD